MDKINKILDTGTPKQVRALFEFDRNTPPPIVLKKYRLWARWFFPKYFKSEDAVFHKDWDMRRVRLYLGKDAEFLNKGFRGSAKTTGAKLFRAFVIANDTSHFRRYMRVLSKDPDNAKQNVTDIYNMLVSRRIKALYPEIFEKTDAKREETMSAFTTSTGIKIAAKSVGVDQRGAVQEDARPDFDWYDDFETRKSLFSATETYKIWINMEEAKNGLNVGGASEYTCNYISERGNVHRLTLKIDPRYQSTIAIGEKKNGRWVASWPGRYSHEEIAALEAGTDDFEGEYLCKPAASKDVYFDRTAVDKQKEKEVIEEVGGLKIFVKYRPENRQAGGHDIGGGVGLDHSASVYMDFDQFPVQVIATRKSNEIKPDAYAHVIAKDGKRFGECYQAPEKNYGSTLDILKMIYPTAMIHRTYDPSPDIISQNPREYGWHTNAATKPMMFADFCAAVEKGLIDLNDPDLIAEVRSYTVGDLMDRDADPRLTTRHFDLLIAACICWAVRKYVRARDLDAKETMPNGLGGVIKTIPPSGFPFRPMAQGNVRPRNKSR